MSLQTGTAAAQSRVVIDRVSPNALRNAVRNLRDTGGTIVINVPARSVFNISSEFPTFRGSNKSLTIAARQRVILDGGGSTGFFQISGRNSTITLRNMVFRNATRNSSERFGGVVGTSRTERNSTIVVENCSFVNCRETKSFAGGGGGAIRARIGNNLFVSDSSFVGCRAASGGAIATTSSNVVLRRCNFENNRSTGGLDGNNKGFRQFNAAGGAVRIDGLNHFFTPRAVVVAACTFTGNVSPEVPADAQRFNRAPAAVNFYTAHVVPNGPTAVFRNNTFVRNTGPFHTARLRINPNVNGEIVYEGNTFRNNSTREGNVEVRD